ncbi:response regulator [Sphingomonas histidinilytica]|jgi:DNA-binding response OmpR family regulator|uniref:Response regulator receiver domain-containing protein n=1 Tax=Rhizorhabdus histidinilytica TaxID=439228 RepID=A0A1T5E2H2_9SPHN|nr:response regulator [Rhizorhabdus histidinilytica]MBO9378041.1 response regulator [Rhizorhabdus histidinilytica]QEH81964.1 response regulator [Sphingomonas sp. C8-2]SKB78006.1 Response regulator receiver domain-containing protein [Rhizorhabdus histidinilytica]
MGPVAGRILVVENDLMLNHMLRQMLEDLGFFVLTAASAEAARHAIDTVSLDVILADMALGTGSDGLSVARAALEKNRQLRVVIASGHPAPADLTQGMAFLQKPFTVAELARMVQN